MIKVSIVAALVVAALSAPGAYAAPDQAPESNPAPESKAAPKSDEAPTETSPCADAELPDLFQTFLDWKDRGWYLPAAGGTMESSEGWTLTKAKVVSGNEPWHVNSEEDGHSLKLPPGAKATSPFMCIDTAFPYFRVFARNTGAASSKLKVEVLFKKETGAIKKLRTRGIRFKKSSWKLSGRLGLASGQAVGGGEVAFRFTPMDDAGKWRIDDLYVDPRRR